MTIEKTLEERGKRYGNFKDHANITQEIKCVMRHQGNWHKLNDSQTEALEMIAHKIGRILNGDPNYDDNWRDIAGYAQLICKQLEERPTLDELCDRVKDVTGAIRYDREV